MILQIPFDIYIVIFFFENFIIIVIGMDSEYEKKIILKLKYNYVHGCFVGTDKYCMR